MAPSTPTHGSETRPRPGLLRTTRSFPRHDAQEMIDPLSRSQRANTFENGTSPEVTVTQHKSPQKHTAAKTDEPDAFEATEAEESVEVPRASVDMEDIPIELVSMTDNFIDSLSAKVHPVPPNIESLSKRFQEFYVITAQHIQTHIASLASRQSRDSSPCPPAPARASTASLLRAKAASFSKEKTKPAPTQEAEQQMLTSEELANRKKARKALEHKRVLLEEGVERRLCEGIYDRIYRHRTTQDEAQDDKLRSKTAALALVGIGPADLGVDLGEVAEDDVEGAAKKQEEISQYLDQARKDLMMMHEKRYPLGKLNQLKAAHKSIVDTLSHFHPSSSADEIMPMLIYTLITMPPEKLNVISDSMFIQRFRWEEKLEGETAYCLTNLEAAITFLETVDLASLRSNETLAGPEKGVGGFETPLKTETFPPAYTPGLSSASQSSPVIGVGTASESKPSTSSTAAKAAAQRRKLSDLIQTPSQAIGNATDSFFNTADQSFKNIQNIGNSLGDSYKLLLGKLRDSSANGKELVVPRTLDDARKLIETPSPDDDVLDSAVSVQNNDDNERPTLRKDDRVLSLVGGKKLPRDRSADSTRSARSASSSKKVVFAEDNKDKAAVAVSTASAASSSNPALVDQMRNLGNTLNPINRLSSMSMMRGFGRTTPTPAQPAAKDTASKPVDGGDLAAAFPDIATALPPKDVPQIKPPSKRFMELQNPADLKLGEVLELLRDYRRLAGALKDMGAFKES